MCGWCEGVTAAVMWFAKLAMRRKGRDSEEDKKVPRRSISLGLTWEIAVVSRLQARAWSRGLATRDRGCKDAPLADSGS